MNFRSKIKDFALCVFIFGLSILLAVVTGCCQPKALTTTLNDSTTIKTNHTKEIVKDTVYVEIPLIVEKRITRDTVSIIENDYARTEALIEQGYLHHSLETKPQERPVVIETVIEYRDSIVEKERLVEVEKVVTEVVAKPDSWFEKLQKTIFWAVVALLSAFVALKASDIVGWVKSVVKIFI